MKKICLILSILFLSSFALAESKATIELSCFEESMFTDGFSNPLNVVIYKSQTPEAYLVTAGTYDPERGKFNPIKTRLLYQNVIQTDSSLTFFFNRGRKSLELVINKSKSPILKKTSEILNNSFYWPANLKSTSIPALPENIELICRHDGLWF